MADFGQGAARVTNYLSKTDAQPVAHLLWPDRRSSPAVDSLVEETVDCFFSRRRCDRRYEQAGLSRNHAAECSTQSAGLVRSESLRRAVIHLGCDERKIEIQRTGILLDEFPFRERKLRHRGDRMAIRPGWSLDRKERSASHAPRFLHFSCAQHPRCEPNDCWRRTVCSANFRIWRRELNIDGRVSFTGFVSQEQLREIYYAVAYFFASEPEGHDGNQEGIPNSMLEAMAGGLPVFATHHGAFPKQSRTAFLACSCLSVIMKNWLLRFWMRRKIPGSFRGWRSMAPETVRKNFDLQRRRRGLEEIYLRADAGLAYPSFWAGAAERSRRRIPRKLP